MSQSRNCSKSVLSRPPHLPPHPPKVENVQNHFFQGIGLTPPYVWGIWTPTICLDAPMHLHTILMPPIPQTFNTLLYIPNASLSISTPQYVQTPLIFFSGMYILHLGELFEGILTPHMFRCPHAFGPP